MGTRPWKSRGAVKRMERRRARESTNMALYRPDHFVVACRLFTFPPELARVGRMLTSEQLEDILAAQEDPLVGLEQAMARVRRFINPLFGIYIPRQAHGAMWFFQELAIHLLNARDNGSNKIRAWESATRPTADSGTAALPRDLLSWVKTGKMCKLNNNAQLSFPHSTKLTYKKRELTNIGANPGDMVMCRFEACPSGDVHHDAAFRLYPTLWATAAIRRLVLYAEYNGQRTPVFFEAVREPAAGVVATMTSFLLDVLCVHDVLHAADALEDAPEDVPEIAPEDALEDA